MKQEQTLSRKDRYRQKRMASFVTPCVECLDVGSVQMPNPYLQNASLTGLDLQEGQLPSNYAKLVVGDACQLTSLFGEEAFDAICAGELIEHLLDPNLFLREAYKALRKDGILVLSTPNPNSIYERLLTLNLSRKYFYCKEHVCLYPQRWMIRMLELAGFSDVRVISGGLSLPGVLCNIPFPRPWAEYAVYAARKTSADATSAALQHGNER